MKVNEQLKDLKYKNQFKILEVFHFYASIKRIVKNQNSQLHYPHKNKQHRTINFKCKAVLERLDIEFYMI